MNNSKQIQEFSRTQKNIQGQQDVFPELRTYRVLIADSRTVLGAQGRLATLMKPPRKFSAYATVVHHNLLLTIFKAGAKSSVLKRPALTHLHRTVHPLTQQWSRSWQECNASGSVVQSVCHPVLPFCQPQFSGLRRTGSGLEAWFQMLAW